MAEYSARYIFVASIHRKILSFLIDIPYEPKDIIDFLTFLSRDQFRVTYLLMFRTKAKLGQTAS